MKRPHTLRDAAIGIAASLTLALVAWPELQSMAYVLHGASFNSASATYHINANFTDPGAGSVADQTAALRAGADEWRINGKGAFAFSLGGTTSVATVAPDGTNAVFYGGRDGGGALAVATWYTSGGRTVQFDIEFFDRDGAFDFVWSVNPGVSDFDIRSVATHEFGHVLGLAHSADVNAVMFPSVAAGSISNRDIKADDIAGYLAVYGSATPLTPVVTSASANDAWIDGSGQVTVLGNNFPRTLTTATIGGVPLTNVSVLDHGRLTATLPPGTSGLPRDIAVTVDGLVTGTGSGVFTYDIARLASPVVFGQYVDIQGRVPEDMGRAYFAATAAGDTGVALSTWDPTDNRIFPLDPDILFLASVYASQNRPDWRNLRGQIDNLGGCTFGFILPNWPQLRGAVIHAAFVTADPSFPSGMRAISNPVRVAFP